MQRTQNSDNTLKNKVGKFILPNIKTCYKAIGIKILWYQHKYKQIDQWNRNKLTQYAKLVFYNGANTIQWRKANLRKKSAERTRQLKKKKKIFNPS